MKCISYSLITWNLPKVYFFYWSYDTFEYFLCLQLLSHWYLIAIIFFLTESKWYLDVFCNAVLFSLFVLKLRQVLLLSTINFLYLPFLHKKFFFQWNVHEHMLPVTINFWIGHLYDTYLVIKITLFDCVM